MKRRGQSNKVEAPQLSAMWRPIERVRLAAFLCLCVTTSVSGDSLVFDNFSGKTHPIELGTRRELFVDHFLIDKLEGLELQMGQPKDEGVVFRYDQPWEGIYSGYGVMMKLAEGDFRYYYRGSPRIIDTPRGKDVEKQNCIAFSKDGIHWERPRLDRHEVYGIRENNVFF